MRFLFISLCFALLMFVLRVGEGSEIEEIPTRRKAWQDYLENWKFQFRAEHPGLITSLTEFSADCQLHIVYDPPPKHQITLKFVRDGKEILSLEGHVWSTFRTYDNKLYIAHFGLTQAGCKLVAYDLTTGDVLWRTNELNGLGPIGHSAYGNQVTMSFVRENGADAAAIMLVGNESYGDYAAILDRKTGTLLAHKVYRKGFSKPDWVKPKHGP